MGVRGLDDYMGMHDRVLFHSFNKNCALASIQKLCFGRLGTILQAHRFGAYHFWPTVLVCTISG